MLTSPEEITELVKSLGTTDSLQHVNREIDLLNAKLTDRDLLVSREELTELGAALATLSGAIADMSRVARTMLAQAGVTANHVG